MRIQNDLNRGFEHSLTIYFQHPSHYKMPGVTINPNSSTTVASWLSQSKRYRRELSRTMELATPNVDEATAAWGFSRPSTLIFDVSTLRASVGKVRMTAEDADLSGYDTPTSSFSEGNAKTDAEEELEEEFGDFQAADPFKAPVYSVLDTRPEGNVKASLLSDVDLDYHNDGEDDFKDTELPSLIPDPTHLEEAISKMPHVEGREEIALRALGVTKPDKQSPGEGGSYFGSWVAAKDNVGEEARAVLKAWGEYWRKKNGVEEQPHENAVAQAPSSPSGSAGQTETEPEEPSLDVEVDGFLERELARWRE
jgi:hypothetical protein